ncbi:MAG: AhpC/TSA family protein [Alphaproteobacteria bacterium]|nr:AhpC/TSA family protein [Alphaproteobacteria bacterium]
MSGDDLVEKLERAVEAAIELDAPLNRRLDVIAEEVRRLSTTFAEAVDRMVDRLKATGAGETAPAVGEPMPPFLLPDEQGRLVSLADILKDGPAAIVFLRGHWCPYCRLNGIALGEVQEEVERLGARLVVIAPERRQYTTETKRVSNASFPVLSDMDNGYALSINLAIWVGDEMAGLIAGAGWDVPSYQGNAAWVLPIPAVFVVGRDGIVAAAHVDPDYRRRMEMDDLLAALRTVS